MNRRVSAKPEVAKKRMDTCKKCPEHRMVLGQMQCKVCKCFMAVKTKLAFTKCPIGKW